MNTKIKLKDESGIALVVALLIMVLLTILGTAAIMTSTTDVKISDNFEDYQETFYAADGGINVAPGIIDRAFAIIDTGTNSPAFTDDPNDPEDDYSLTYTGDLMTELQAATPDSSATADTAADTDISTTIGSGNVNIDVDYVAVMRLAGGSTESQSRYEGIGAGGSAFADQYRIHSVASSSTGSSQTKVQSLYQRIQK